MSDITQFSNTTVVRRADGGLLIRVGNETILGATQIRIDGGVLMIVLPMAHVVLAEETSVKQVDATKSNVNNIVEFPNMRKAQDATTVLPPTEDKTS